MHTWFAVAMGGAIGSAARHGVNVLVARRMLGPGPASTAVVNVIGCLAIGILAGLIATGHVRMSAVTRAFLFVGVLGGFTTFSSFGLDTFTLVQEGRSLQAAANVLIQMVAGIAAVFAGYAIGSWR